MASLSINSFAVSNTGAECANSGNTTSRTGRNGAAPATAESFIESMRSVFARIAWRSIGFGMSVWQHATEYLMWSIFTLDLSTDYTDFTDRKKFPGEILSHSVRSADWILMFVSMPVSTSD